MDTGFLLDISKISKVTDEQHLELLASQYGGARNFNAVKFFGKSNTRYIELYPNKQIVKKFQQEGVVYETQKIQLLPSKSLEGQGTVIKLNLSDLPPLDEPELLTGLTEALSHFGIVLDIGINRETRMGWFMGTGYAVIQRMEGIAYPDLRHNISWGDNGEYCYATFPDMPTWCRYCHGEGHTKYECAKATAGILCYSCDRYGHKSIDCPNPKSTKLQSKASPFKKARKTPSKQRDDASDEFPTSEELMKSIHAPKPAPVPVASTNVSMITDKEVSSSPSTVEDKMINNDTAVASMDEDEAEDPDYTPDDDIHDVYTDHGRSDVPNHTDQYEEDMVITDDELNDLLLDEAIQSQGQSQYKTKLRNTSFNSSRQSSAPYSLQ